MLFAPQQLRESQQSKTEAPSNVPVDTLLDLTDTGTPTTKSAVPWDDSGLREEAIRLHFTNRVNNLAQAVGVRGNIVNLFYSLL